MFVSMYNHPCADHLCHSSQRRRALGPLSVLEDELRRFLAWNQFLPTQAATRTPITPAQFELKDDGARWVLTANLPGLSAKDVELSITNNQLTVRGQRKTAPPAGYGVRHQERKSYAFDRSFRLPNTVNTDQVEAQLLNGRLTVTLPKIQAATPRRINVQAS